MAIGIEAVALLHDRNLPEMQNEKQDPLLEVQKRFEKMEYVRRNQIDIVSRGHFLDSQKWVPFLCIFSHTVRSSTGGAAAIEKFNIDHSQS